ncbi:MAG: hypothetical protein WBM86_26630, partial [Waterburya sp.]
IEDKRWQVEALTKLAPYLPAESQAIALKEAIIAVSKIEDERWRAETLVKFPRLPEPLLREAEVLTRQITDEFWRTRVMIWLALQFSEPLKENLLREALMSAKKIKNEHRQVAALVRLSPQLSEPLLQKALQVTKAISDEDDRAQLLARLASCFAKLNHPLKAIEIVQGITDEYWYTEALAEISVDLAELGHLRDAFETAQAITYEHLQVKTLARLTPYLPVTMRNKLLRELLAKAQAIVERNNQARVLETLAPYLPKLLMQEAVLTAQAIKNEDSRKLKLVELIPHLAKLGDSWEAQKLVEQEFTDGYWKAIALANLVFHLPNDIKGNVLQKVLVETQGVADRDKLAEVMTKLAPFLDTPQTAGLLLHLYLCWRKMLRLLSLGSRQKLLTALQNLLPIPIALADAEVGVQIACTTLNVGQWWR